MAKTATAVKIADDTFERTMTNPKDMNARIIAATRKNVAAEFDSDLMIPRAKNAAKRVANAALAVSALETNLERFKP